MQEKNLQLGSNAEQNQNDTQQPQRVDNRPLPQICLQASTPNEPVCEKSSTMFPYPMPMYMPPFQMDQHVEARQPSNHSMMYLMSSMPNRPKTPPSNTFLTPSRVRGPIMTAYQTPPVKQHMEKRSHRKPSPSDGESDRSCEEDEIDVVNDTKSNDTSRDIDSSMSINNVSALESPSTGSSNSSSPASNSTNSPSSSTDNSGNKKKVRTNYSPSQVQALEKVFHENPYPEPETMEKLASDLEIAEAKIKVWFQNKRARWRRRAQENPHPAYMTPMSPMMSPMGSYGLVPHHHPMLHGSPAQVVPGPFFYPGHPTGTPVHHNPASHPFGTPAHHNQASHTFGTPGQAVPTTPGSNGSPASTTSSTASPSNSENQKNQSPNAQMTSPYQHRLPHFSPYMPFSYPYGVCPPYYC